MHPTAATPPSQLSDTSNLTAQSRLFDRLQLALISAIAFIAVISSPRLQLLERFALPNIPMEFRIIALSLPDYLVLGLLIVTGLRLAIDSGYRAQLSSTAQPILTRYGGIWWLTLLVWMAVGMLWARDPVLTRYTTLHAVAVTGMAFIIAELVRRRGLLVPLSALLIGAVVQTIIAILQVINQGPLGLGALGEINRFYYETQSFYRAPGLSMHQNYLGGYLMLAVFAGVLIAWTVRTRRLLPAAVVVLSGVGILATLSRSAILGTAVGFVPVVLLALRQASPKVRRFVVIGLVGIGVVGAALAVVFTRGDIVTRFFTGREFFFDFTWDALEAVPRSPLIGLGAYNLMNEIGLLYGESIRELLPVHNVYLFIWAELGVPGLVLFVLGCLSVLRRLSTRYGAAAFLLACAFLAVAVVMLFDNYWWAVHPFRVLFYWLIGLWWATMLRSDEQPAPAVVPTAPSGQRS